MRVRQRPPDGHGVLFRRPGARELGLLADALRAETVGGALLLAATVVALILANTGARAWYVHLQHFAIGPSALLLHLSLEEWAADGLLAIFFFIAGLELKRELVAGEMRRLSCWQHATRTTENWRQRRPSARKVENSGKTMLSCA